MKLTVDCRGEITSLQIPGGVRLLDMLSAADIPVNAACGGNGTCNKCRIRVKEGFLGISNADRKAFTPQELGAGWRLSCQAIPRTNVSCLIPDVENFRARPRLIYPKVEIKAEHPTLVCDLGSTGVVVALGNDHAQAMVEAHLLNRQVRYGADVMSRLKAAQDRGTAALQEQLVASLLICLKDLEEKFPELYRKAAPGGLYCSGNSAMVSFLNGWDISSLATSPFQPLYREAATSQPPTMKINTHTLPLMGGFVGADTFAGVLYLEHLLTREANGEAKRGAEKPTPGEARGEGQPGAKKWMLVDIGTNTEIVMNNGRGELWFSSAPAGPAFEGGNIAQGMRAEPGAIAKAKYVEGEWELETIGHDKARGICGSGLMDVLVESIRAELITRDGYLPSGKLELSPEISLMADDIREFQLAKSATRTACDLLIDRAGEAPEVIYLAGTFAEHLNPAAIAGVGLLPPDIACRTLGNASLKGTLLYAAMSAEERRRSIDEIEKRLHPVELALQDDFQDAFVKNLNF